MNAQASYKNEHVAPLLKRQGVFLYIEAPEDTQIIEVLSLLSFQGAGATYSRAEPHSEFLKFEQGYGKPIVFYDSTNSKINFEEGYTLMKVCNQHPTHCDTGKELTDLLTEKGLRVAIHDYDWSHQPERAWLIE